MVKIADSGFGSITIDGKRYNHDIWVLADGSVEERKGSYHAFLAEEVQALLKGEPEAIIVGTGTAGCVGIDGEANRLAKRKGIDPLAFITPNALEKYNQLASKDMKVALAFHVTCLSA